MQEAAESGAGKTRPGGGKSFARRLWHLLWMLAAVFLVIIVLALINNNFSLRSPSRAEFRAQVDHGIETSTKWLMGHPEIQNNPSTMFMIADMEKMSGDPRLRTMLDQYMHSRYVRDPFDPMSYVWARLVDPKAEVPMVRVSLPPGAGLERTGLGCVRCRTRPGAIARGLKSLHVFPNSIHMGQEATSAPGPGYVPLLQRWF